MFNDSTDTPYELEGLAEDDYNNLVSLINEEPEKDTMTYSDLNLLLEDGLQNNL